MVRRCCEWRAVRQPQQNLSYFLTAKCHPNPPVESVAFKHHILLFICILLMVILHWDDVDRCMSYCGVLHSHVLPIEPLATLLSAARCRRWFGWPTEAAVKPITVSDEHLISATVFEGFNGHDGGQVLSSCHHEKHTSVCCFCYHQQWQPSVSSRLQTALLTFWLPSFVSMIMTRLPCSGNSCNTFTFKYLYKQIYRTFVFNLSAGAAQRWEATFHKHLQKRLIRRSKVFIIISPYVLLQREHRYSEFSKRYIYCTL